MSFPKIWVRTLLIGTSLASSLLPSLALADRPLVITPPTVQEKHFIADALQLSVTPRGMNYFATNLGDFLESQGIAIDQGYFPGFIWEANRNFRADDLNLTTEQRNLLNIAKNLIPKWLVGFAFNDEFRPAIQIGDLAYGAKFNKFSLVMDRTLLQKIGKKTGAVLAIELEIASIDIDTDKIRISDHNNPVLTDKSDAEKKNDPDPFPGRIGMDGVSIKVRTGKDKFKVRLPFYVRINEKQELEFQAIDVTLDGLDKLDIQLSYQKLLAPRVSVIVNDRRFEMSQKEFEATLNKKLPEIMVQAKGFLKQFATEQLPALLNSKSKQLMSGNLLELNRMDPVGADRDPCLPPPVPFVWGIQPAADGLDATQGPLNLKLNAFVEDPKNPYQPIDPSTLAQGKLNLTQVSQDSYDVALAIDRGFINRMLELSYLRGIFNNMAIDKAHPQGPKMDLVKKPQFSYSPAPAGAPVGPDMTYMKMMTKARVQKGFLQGFQQKMALREPFEVDIGVIVKMMKNQYGQIRLYYYGIDPDSIHIDRQYLTGLGSIFEGTVHSQAVSALEDVARKWRAQNAQISEDPLPIPQEVGGIRLLPNRISFDPSGHLVMYMNYAQPGSPVAPFTPPKYCQRGGQ